MATKPILTNRDGSFWSVFGVPLNVVNKRDIRNEEIRTVPTGQIIDGGVRKMTKGDRSKN